VAWRANLLTRFDWPSSVEDEKTTEVIVGGLAPVSERGGARLQMMRAVAGRTTRVVSAAIVAAAMMVAVSCGYSGIAALEDPLSEAGGPSSEASPDGPSSNPDGSVPRGCHWPSLQAGAPWPMLGGCATHAGRSAFRGPRKPPRQVWQADTRAYHPVPAIGADDTVYVPADNDGILAFSPDGGSRRIEVGGGDVTNTPAIGKDGTLYFGAQNFAVTRKPDGGVVRYDLKDQVDTSPVIDADGNVYTGSFSDKLVSFTGDGAFRWELPTGGDVSASPAIGPNGVIYIGSWNNRLYAVLKNATRLWEYDTGGPVKSSPVVADDDTIYVGTTERKLHAIAPDGTKKWTWDAPGGFEWQILPALGWDGTIYAATSSKVVALRPDGTVLWTFDPQHNVRTALVVDVEGVIYVGTDSNRLFAITPEGQELWQVDVKDPPSGFAIGRDGTIYVTCDNSDRIHAFRE
jgi:outer membrane protein assembly factor BamB